MKDKALCTILYGERYIDFWKRHCEANWREYARRQGYDLVIVDGPIRRQEDLHARPIHWQKLFLPFHEEIAGYKNAVFLDADIMINHHKAPCIVEAANSDKVGIVSLQKYFDDDFLYYRTFMRMIRYRYYSQREKFQASDRERHIIHGPERHRHYARFTDRADLPFLNTGVLVMKPALHRDLLESIYLDSFRDMDDGAVKGDYEQSYLAWRLLEMGMVKELDPLFNTIVSYEIASRYPFVMLLGGEPELIRICLTTMLHNCYFLHFAADVHLMDYPTINESGDLAIMNLADVYRHDREFYNDNGRAGIEWINRPAGE